MGVLYNTRYALSALTVLTSTVMVGLLSYSIHENPSAGLHLGIPLSGYILAIILATGFTVVPNTRPGSHPDPVKDFCQANTFFLRLFALAVLPAAFSASVLTGMLVSGKLCTDLDPALLAEGIEEKSCFNGGAGVALSWIPPSLALAGAITTIVIVWGVGLPPAVEASLRAQELASQRRRKTPQDIETGREGTHGFVTKVELPFRRSCDSEATVTPPWSPAMESNEHHESSGNEKDRWVEIKL